MEANLRATLAARVREMKRPASISPIVWDIAARHFAQLIAESPELAEVERERDNLKEAYRRAIDAVDRVFQECRENPEPILPDFLALGADKFQGVVKLAEAYKDQSAELTQLRAEVVGLREHLNNMLREYDTQEAQFGDDYCWTKWADVEAVAAARAALGEGER